MPMGFAAFGKRVAATLGLEVKRAGRTNRFEAMRHTLALLRKRGFDPTFVIDAGANVGNWTRMASKIFPSARFALVEPQPGCHAALSVYHPPRFRVHHVALTAPGIASVTMTAGGGQRGSGAFVATGAPPPEVVVTSYPAATLDDLFASDIAEGGRVLLKLDLEGHELHALRGATAMLAHVEVVVCEVTFFDVYALGTRVVFHDVYSHFTSNGFELYDFGSLLGRERDQRLFFGDAVFVRKGSPLVADVSWD
jgi:FkbM family methyltransferase